IYLYDGAKLTVKGAPAQGTTGGGAGIELMGGHHLLVCGNGSVVATGGDAAEGAPGEDGAEARAQASGRSSGFTAILDWSVSGGRGGAGGAGGGGAGAGIGTPGATGGAGGAGGAASLSTEHDKHLTIGDLILYTESVGGSAGDLGTLGSPCSTSVGTLSIVGADGDCSVRVAGGSNRDGSASTGHDSPEVRETAMLTFSARGGQGGLGGMSGSSGQNFGSGGAGGTGGTGGAGGGYVINSELKDPPGYPGRDVEPRWPEGSPVWGKVRSSRSQTEDLIGGGNPWTKFTAEDAMDEWPFVEPIFVKHATTGGTATSGACVSLTRGRLAMDNCRVSDFRRDFGGVLVLDTNSGATFNRTVFSGNSAVREGGVIYGQGGTLSFTNCVFDANRASLGGLLSGSNTTVLVEGCTICSNTASLGGAIYLKGRNESNPTRLTLANCSVLDNGASTLGGAVWGEHVDTVLVGTTFRGNMVGTADGNGAGLFLQGKGSSAALANVLLVGNCVTGTSTELNFAVSGVATNTAPPRIRVYSSKVGNGFPSILTAGKDDAVRAYIGSAYADVSRTYLDSIFARRVDTVDVDGILQRFERTQPTAESIGNPLTGWPVQHNADWSTVVVYSNSTAGTSWMLRGSSSKAKEATIPVSTDITQRSFKNPEPQMGSFWMVQDRPTLEVDTLRDVIDPWDAQVSLHEILKQIMDENSPWATNLVKNRRFDITFKDGLEGTILQAIDPVKITGLTGCVFTVTGPTNRTIVIDGQDKWRAFAVGVSNTLHVSNLTMSNCLGRTYGSYSADGGGILNEGNLVVSNCAFYACAAGRYRTDPMGNGGAIHTTRNAKTLVKNATFGDNVAAHGGALAVADGGQLTVLHSTFDGNVAQGGGSVYDANGGAVLVKGATADALLANCTFTANEVVQGSSAAPGHAVAVDGSGAKAPTAKIVNGILCGNGTNDLQATRGSQVRIAYTAFGARMPGVDTNIWDDISITSNATAMAVFAHLDAEGRPLARRLVHDGTRHRVYPLLEGADFDAVYVRGDAIWTKAAWSVNGSSSWKLLRGTSALAAGCVKMTLDQVGTTYDQPKIGAVVAAEERGADDPPAPVDPATPGAIQMPTVDALVAAIKEVAAFNPAVTFATNTAVNGTVRFTEGIAFAESEEGARKTLEIHGPMTFDAQGQSRFFTVPNGLTLKLYDITFVNGKVEGEDESGAGGAILVLDGGRLYASNCTFRANAATYGGAVAQLGDTSSTTFIDCTFDENVAEDPEYGNAIYHEGTSELVLEGTSIDAADIMDYPDVVLTTPVIASIDVVDGVVAIWPRDPQPNVYYGLAWTTDLAAGFSAETIMEWVRSDGHGVLPRPLSAPATGDRCFYRIFVRADKP
ncbi:MAG: right-handed parallel beta-helix repeat-containing protein, partial [bacterium]|nr:right-handed parallel beta-helix repeat-containing protein [bacterium]